MAQFYGNEQIQHTLHQMLLRDRAPHGFLFYGETGLGKKTLAKQFLAELLCTGTEKPCGSCKSCKMLADGVHPDVRFVEHRRQAKRLFRGHGAGGVRGSGIAAQRGQCQVLCLWGL